MNDNGFNALYLALMMILPISALAARRLPIADVLKMALAWAVMFLLVMLWQDAFGGGGPAGGTSA